MIGTVGPKGQVTKWVSLAAGIFVQALAGHATVFPHYSSALKDTLQINQVQLNNLGVAKDFGENIGLLAGGLVNLLPTWVILLIGAIECFVGYGIMWLVMSGRIAPLPYWQMIIVLCLAANSMPWFNTAVLVTSMRNFSTNRGTVVGIIKGFIGLSGAVITQIYVSLMTDNPTELVLFLALGPPLVCVAVMYFIRPVISRDGAPPYYDPREHSGFVFIHVVCISLSMYLFVATVGGNIIALTPLVLKIMLAVLVIFLAAPFLVPAKFLFDKRTWKAVNQREHSYPYDDDLPPSGVSVDDDLQEPLLKSNENNGNAASPGAGAGGHGKLPVSLSGSRRIEPVSSDPDLLSLSSPRDRSKHEDPSFICLAPNNPDIDIDCDDSTLLAVGEGALRMRRRKGPHRGEDFTLSEAMVKADFWLLFLTYFCGVGTGNTVTNNMGQIGLAQGYSDVTMFVSLYSVCNFLGRLGAGSLSEHYVRSSAIPRTVWMLVAQFVMIVSYLLLASALPGSLPVGSMLLGISFGIHVAIMVPVASELFGLANFGVIYNFITIGMPLATLLFSGGIAGYIYDKEAAKQQPGRNINDMTDKEIITRFWSSAYPHHLQEGDDGGPICLGAHCFRTTFIIMAFVMVFGLLMNLLLTHRIWPVYKSLYSNSQQNSSTNLEEGERGSISPRPQRVLQDH